MKPTKPKAGQLTPYESPRDRLKRRYTYIDKGGSSWFTHLRIGPQTFCVAAELTKQNAQWFQDKLVTALEQLVKEEKAANRTR